MTQGKSVLCVFLLNLIYYIAQAVNLGKTRKVIPVMSCLVLGLVTRVLHA